MTKRVQILYTTYATLGSLLLLTACGSSNDTGSDIESLSVPGLAISGWDINNPNDMSTPWLATITTFRLDSKTPGTGDSAVRTIQYDNPRTLQDTIDRYSEQVVLEVCETNTIEDSDSNTNSSDFSYVSAGANVVINASNGTWFTLIEGDTGVYRVDNELPGAIPAGASVSIPGLDFPSVGAIPITEPTAPVRISPELGPVSIDSLYQWQPVGGDGASILLSFIEYDSEGDYVAHRIQCEVEDDGEFMLPDDALTTIASTANTIVVRYARSLRSLGLVDGVTTFSRVSVAE